MTDDDVSATCCWGRGPDPVSGCDNPAGADDLCPEHSAALAELERNAPPEDDADTAGGVIAGLIGAARPGRWSPVNRRDARREARHMAGAHVQLGLDIGEFAELLESDNYTPEEVAMVLEEMNYVAEMLGNVKPPRERP